VKTYAAVASRNAVAAGTKIATSEAAVAARVGAHAYRSLTQQTIAPELLAVVFCVLVSLLRSFGSFGVVAEKSHVGV